ncbi:uncharacterized protein LOC133403340 isoform X2 [Phycodurus eques]|uniref:uncharacterized protein LOC133403340 isoform X2 n=1 Tax=Phycodurus eques TaxID=693459 RepID=UPI002ACE07AC|nr:uncharacterized protein LOC133403340 isoform X2 [Phycodurus eques]XP_061534241.1 uncharacterized protein LOC133403340 isoform X2 [Phycodurus eques]XP_061534242.1 uncharacterized protein LOC133403340 isoform X2 [Phycodurus eques]
MRKKTVGALNRLNKRTSEELLLKISKDFGRSAAMCFTETWICDAVPDGAVMLPSFHIHRADRDMESSGKTKGGGICFYINEKWCTDVTEPSPHCSPHLEYYFMGKLVCQNSSSFLECLQGSVIRIQSAFYGRRRDDVCSAEEGSEGRCVVQGVLPHSRRKCDNYQDCYANPLNEDICPAVYTCPNTWRLFTAVNRKEWLHPDKARLNRHGCWKPSFESPDSWIQVNLGQPRKVTGIVTQECRSSSPLAVIFEMHHCIDGMNWMKHSDGYIRLLVVGGEKDDDVVLRFDILGCTPDGSPASTSSAIR